MTHTHPVPDIEETLLTGQVEHQQESHGISEESCSEAAEPKKSKKKSTVLEYNFSFCFFPGVFQIKFNIYIPIWHKFAVICTFDSFCP